MTHRHKRGAQLVEQLSPGFEADLRSKLGAIAPDFVDYTIEFPFCEIYSRPGLDIRSRQFVTISALVTLGAFDQLRTHLRICRTIGVTATEVSEVIMQLAVYSGWPRALSALTIAAEEFREE